MKRYKNTQTSKQTIKNNQKQIKRQRNKQTKNLTRDTIRYSQNLSVFHIAEYLHAIILSFDN